jgi:hypothetical protein
MDYKYSTARDATVAAIIAYDRLIKYIDIEIRLLRNVSSINSSNFHSNATFTDHNVYLVELIYALHSAKVINYGNIELNELAQMFEKMFNVKLDDYYRTLSHAKRAKPNFWIT